MKPMIIAATLFLAHIAGVAFASVEDPTKEEAIAMVERGAAYFKANGKEELAKKIAVKDPSFAQGSLYIAMRDIKTGIMLAHPYNPSIVGKDLVDVPDANGKRYRREIVDLAQKTDKGWVDYMYKNPVSGKIEPKTTYILRVSDFVLEAGIYKK